MNLRCRYICPFCMRTIIEYDEEQSLDQIDKLCLEHITKYHPIKWRFNKKFRRAVKQYMSQMENG